MHPKQRPEATSKKKASRPSWILIRIFIARCRRIYWRTFGAEIRAATWDSFPWSAKWGNRMGPKKRDSERPKFGQRSDRLHHHRVNRGRGGGGGSCMKFYSVRKIIFSARGCLPSNFLKLHPYIPSLTQSFSSRFPCLVPRIAAWVTRPKSFFKIWPSSLMSYDRQSERPRLSRHTATLRWHRDDSSNELAAWRIKERSRADQYDVRYSWWNDERC